MDVFNGVLDLYIYNYILYICIYYIYLCVYVLCKNVLFEIKQKSYKYLMIQNNLQYVFIQCYIFALVSFIYKI